MTQDQTPRSSGAEEFFRAVIESTADGILVVGHQGQVLSSNRRFAEIWHLPEEVLATRDDERMVASVLEQLVDPDAFLKKIQELYLSPEQRLDLLRFKEGRVIERFSTPFMETGELAGRVWSFRDVTERRRAEEDRRLMETRIRDTQRLESLGVLAGGIAHDFNNMLVGILGNADLVLSLVQDRPQVRDLVGDIVEASKQAAGLCNELLAYSGKGNFVIQPVNLSEIVVDMTHLLELSISKQVEVRYDFTADLPPIDADVSQLRQVVMNLITNASDALRGNEGVIEIATGCARYGSEFLASTLIGSGLAAGDYVSLRVSDTGEGMDETTLAQIFEPFFTTKSSGRGLGLASILGIMRGHGGTIRVESEVGRGSTFQVLFPVSSRKLTDRAEDTPASQEQGEGVVLIVDDEDSVRMVAGKILENAGYEVMRCADGQTAIDLFDDPGHGIRAVLLDLTMPGLDGIETLRALRKVAPEVGVVLSSGYHAQTTAELLSAEEIPVSFIQKPYRSEDLVRGIRRAMKGL
jgi:two-component system cell cycle sensor histidine kinase/response regulator CckA